jgi:hypothetical protein
MCRTLQVAPSTYYAAVCRQPSARQLSDEQLKREIARVHRDNFGVYGIEKVWRQLNREGKKVGRDRVARLMQDKTWLVTTPRKRAGGKPLNRVSIKNALINLHYFSTGSPIGAIPIHHGGSWSSRVTSHR